MLLNQPSLHPSQTAILNTKNVIEFLENFRWKKPRNKHIFRFRGNQPWLLAYKEKSWKLARLFKFLSRFLLNFVGIIAIWYNCKKNWLITYVSSPFSLVIFAFVNSKWLFSRRWREGLERIDWFLQSDMWDSVAGVQFDTRSKVKAWNSSKDCCPPSWWQQYERIE